jgi:hypothetical protein
MRHSSPRAAGFINEAHGTALGDGAERHVKSVDEGQ